MATIADFHSVIILIFLLPTSLGTEAGERHVRFEYKYSFKGPHLVSKDGGIPFWTHGGSAIPSDEQIRLTPSMTNKRGYAWAKNKFTNQWWEVEVAMKVAGRGRLGGDGLAIWFTETTGIEGPAFGNSNTWNGLGVFCDSFDNDQQGNNPFISVVINDGTQTYDHNKDGQDLQRGGCLRDFRNRPNPVKLKIRYYENVLTLWVHMGMSMRPEDYELCARLENINLPGGGGFFGLSAATGGLADDHDVLSFITHSLTPPKKETESEASKGMTDEEQQKLAQQYEEYQKKLEQQREEYKTSHPDKVRRPETEYENIYERDVRLVYEGQNAIHQMISNLHTKVGELTVQINTLYTVVTSDHSKMNNVVTVDKTINRQEVNTLINMQQQLSAKLQEISNSLSGARNMEKRDVPDVGSKLSDMQNAIESLTHSVNSVATKQQMASKDKKDCPPPPAMPQCIGPGYFVVLIIAQLVMLIGYIGYKNQKEAAAKKFF